MGKFNAALAGLLTFLKKLSSFADTLSRVVSLQGLANTIVLPIVSVSVLFNSFAALINLLLAFCAVSESWFNGTGFTLAKSVGNLSLTSEIIPCNFSVGGFASINLVK